MTPGSGTDGLPGECAWIAGLQRPGPAPGGAGRRRRRARSSRSWPAPAYGTLPGHPTVPLPRPCRTRWSACGKVVPPRFRPSPGLPGRCREGMGQLGVAAPPVGWPALAGITLVGAVVAPSVSGRPRSGVHLNSPRSPPTSRSPSSTQERPPTQVCSWSTRRRAPAWTPLGCRPSEGPGRRSSAGGTGPAGGALSVLDRLTAAATTAVPGAVVRSTGISALSGKRLDRPVQRAERLARRRDRRPDRDGVGVWLSSRTASADHGV